MGACDAAAFITYFAAARAPRLRRVYIRRQYECYAAYAGRRGRWHREALKTLPRHVSRHFAAAILMPGRRPCRQESRDTGASPPPLIYGNTGSTLLLSRVYRMRPPMLDISRGARWRGGRMRAICRRRVITPNGRISAVARVGRQMAGAQRDDYICSRQRGAASYRAAADARARHRRREAVRHAETTRRRLAGMLPLL